MTTTHFIAEPLHAPLDAHCEPSRDSNGLPIAAQFLSSAVLAHPGDVPVLWRAGKVRRWLPSRASADLAVPGYRITPHTCEMDEFCGSPSDCAMTLRARRAAAASQPSTTPAPG